MLIQIQKNRKINVSLHCALILTLTAALYWFEGAFSKNPEQQGDPLGGPNGIDIAGYNMAQFL